MKQFVICELVFIQFDTVFYEACGPLIDLTRAGEDWLGVNYGWAFSTFHRVDGQRIRMV